VPDAKIKPKGIGTKKMAQKNCGKNFDLKDDKKILDITSPADKLKGPFAIVHKDLKERFVIVTLKWNTMPRLGIRWFNDKNGSPTCFGLGLWFILPPTLNKSILDGLSLTTSQRNVFDDFLSGK
jgi:hypothetical protein